MEGAGGGEGETSDGLLTAFRRPGYVERARTKSVRDYSPLPGKEGFSQEVPRDEPHAFNSRSAVLRRAAIRPGLGRR